MIGGRAHLAFTPASRRVSSIPLSNGTGYPNKFEQNYLLNYSKLLLLIIVRSYISPIGLEETTFVLPFPDGSQRSRTMCSWLKSQTKNLRLKHPSTSYKPTLVQINPKNVEIGSYQQIDKT